LVWLWKLVLKFLNLLKGLLSNLSNYPGLGFLRSPANRLAEYLSSYYTLQERRERIERNLAITKQQAAALEHTVAPPAYKKASPEDPSRPPEKAGANPGTEGGSRSSPNVSGGSAAVRQPGSASDPKGTLMLDAFMQRPDIPPDLKQRWLDAAAEREQQTSPEQGKPAYYGTLVPPDRAQTTEAQLLAAANPRALEPLFSDTVQMAPAGHATAGALPGRALDAPGERQEQEPPFARWQAPPPVDLRSAGMATAAEDAGDGDRVNEYLTAPSAGAWLDEDQPAMIPLAEREQQLSRLAYVCQILRDARQPLCPLNGALTILPLGTIEAGPREVVELQRAVKADLASIQSELKLRFPVTALAVGLEEDRGFEELVRRVGRERTKSQRFGHRFDVRAVATPSQLKALSARISGVFEDWVYVIFRERGSVFRAGNSHLFGLLCKVRTQLQDRLVRILCGGFGHDPERSSRGEPVAFSGCYFAATGRTEDSRAFVEGVFDKLNEEQDSVEWTKEAIREDLHFRRIGWAGLLVIAACGAALLASHFLRQI
jgi:hypothetical protein